jgi:hypothetical protein
MMWPYAMERPSYYTHRTSTRHASGTRGQQCRNVPIVTDSNVPIRVNGTDGYVETLPTN